MIGQFCGLYFTVQPAKLTERVIRVSFPARPINLREKKKYLTNLDSRSVVQVTDPRFFSVDLWPAREINGENLSP